MDDIATKVALGVTATLATGALIVLPNDKQKDSASYALYDKPYGLLAPHEKKAADFTAGYKRWRGFVENNVYSWTRKLPGHDNPIMNPYRGPRQRKAQPEEPQQQGAEQGQ